MQQKSPPIPLQRDRGTRIRDRMDRVPATGARPPAVDFMYVGVQKAGSSWLYQALSRHPQLVLGRGGDDKDTCFFSYHYDRGYEWYERHFHRRGDGRLVGEISTSYFACADAPVRIARYNPAMKLVLCLRNPVDRVISNHLHEIRLGHISRRNYPLSEGISNNPAYLDQSRYCTLLNRWLQSFSLNDIHIILFEHLFEAPSRHLGALYRFLGVDAEPSGDFPEGKVNEGRIPISRTVEQISGQTSRLLRKLAPASALRAIKRTGLHHAAVSANSRSAPEQLMDDSLRRELEHLFRGEIEALEKLTGIDLSVWSGADGIPEGTP
jgi:hypothetical protein